MSALSALKGIVMLAGAGLVLLGTFFVLRK